ncbi:5531_t:CDS:2, partial [Racocetra persica]
HSCRNKKQDNFPKDIYLINQTTNYCYECALFTMNNIDNKPEIGGINKHEQINELDEHWMTNEETKQAFCGECFLKVAKVKGNVKLAQADNTHEGEEISEKNEYPKEERKDIKELNISRKNLEGNLELSDFINLERLDCYDNKLTGLNVNGLDKLRVVVCFDNNLADLQLNDCFGIVSLNASGNNFVEINLSGLVGEKLTYVWFKNNPLKGNLSIFSRFSNLEKLYLDNTFFSGSLETLHDCSKLRELSISNTNIDSGLEYLPDSIEDFACSVDKRPEAKVKAIYDLFASEQGITEETEYGRIKDFAKKIKVIKNKAKEKAHIILKSELRIKEQQEVQIADQSAKIQELEQEQNKLKQLSALLLPHQTYNFSVLEAEIKRLKIQELAPQKTGTSLEKTIDLLLEAHQQSEQATQIYLQDKLSGKIEAYQSILEDSLTKEEMQTLLNRQTELLKLENHLSSLQQSLEQTAQIQQTELPKPFNN